MRSEQALREAAGLEQGKAQQDRVAHYLCRFGNRIQKKVYVDKENANS